MLTGQPHSDLRATSRGGRRVDAPASRFYAERLEPSATLRLQTTIQCLRAN